MATVKDLRSKIREIQRDHSKEGSIFYDKLRFKKFLSQHGIRTPETYLYITNSSKIDQIKQYDNFIIKPKMGSCGMEIYSLEKINDDEYLEIDGRTHNWAFVVGKIGYILRFRQAAGVIIEERVYNPPPFEVFLNGFKSIVDMRLYILNDEILFGKLRIPTKMSHGYGNTGRKAAAFFISKDGIIRKDNVFKNTTTVHPDTNKDFENFKVPYWDQFKITAERVAKIFNIPFHSVDMTIDQNGKGTVIESEKIPFLSHFTNEGCGLVMNEIDVASQNIK